MKKVSKMLPSVPSEKVLNRFWSMVDRKPSGCWEWMRAKVRGGYGVFGFSGKTWRAHRFAWMVTHGEIPDVLDHLCRNTSCVNPSHMQAVTHRENTLRGTGEAAHHAAKAHCKHGHELTPANTLISKTKAGTPTRQCRRCHRIRQHERVLKIGLGE